MLLVSQKIQDWLRWNQSQSRNCLTVSKSKPQCRSHIFPATPLIHAFKDLIALCWQWAQLCLPMRIIAAIPKGAPPLLPSAKPNLDLRLALIRVQWVPD